jgi:Zn-dependent protease/ribosomal protein S18 acetylase RimI-like enzyme
MQVLVREMRSNEKGDIEKLFGRSLSIIDRIVFQLSFEDAQKSARKQSGGTLTAKYDDKIVGAVSMRIQTVKDKRTGYIDAIVADKEFRGKAIGKSLADGAISWLEEHGCEVIYATADRYNSPSWNMFIHRGFHLYEIPQQLRDYGLNFLRLWLGEFHFIGFGTFFLRRDKEQRRPRETGESWHLLAALLGVSIVWWIQLLRSGGSLTLVPTFFVVVAISLLAHEFSQKLVAHRLGLETTFKAWGSGLLFGWLLALVGGFFPAYGSTYVKQLDWWYESKRFKNGIFFVMGPFVSLVLAFAFWTLPTLLASSLLVASAKVGYTINLMIVIFNLIPIQAAHLS